MTARQAKPPAQQSEQLTTTAIAVTIALLPSGHGKNQRDEKTQQPKPGKENVEKAWIR